MNWFRKASDGNRADGWYQQALEILHRVSENKDKKGDLDRGIQLCRQARTVYHASKPEGSSDEAMCLSLEGALHRIRMAFQESIECHEQECQIIQKVEPSSEAEAQCLANLAELYRATYNLSRGTTSDGTLLVKALRFVLQAHGLYTSRYPTHIGYIVALHTMGVICRECGEFDVAESLLSRAALLFNRTGEQQRAQISLGLLADMKPIKERLKKYNIFREAAFQHLDSEQRKEIEQLLKQAREIGRL